MNPSIVLLSLIAFGAGVQAFDANTAILDRLISLERQNIAQEERIKELEETKCSQERGVRALQNDAQIAFTSYVQADLDNVAPNTNVIFDAVLHNDGAGYDSTTGVFTAPVQGVYFFTFFVGQKDDNKVNVQLTVNKQNWVDAAAEGVEISHNDQGGNAATVPLNAGDQVKIKHRHVGNHIEGSTFLRLSTFSGFLLYLTDSPSAAISTISSIIG